MVLWLPIYAIAIFHFGTRHWPLCEFMWIHVNSCTRKIWSGSTIPIWGISKWRLLKLKDKKIYPRWNIDEETITMYILLFNLQILLEKVCCLYAQWAKYQISKWYKRSNQKHRWALNKNKMNNIYIVCVK